MQSWTKHVETFSLFHFLVQSVFTTGEGELDYYNRKVNLQVASQVAERLKKFQENP